MDCRAQVLERLSPAEREQLGQPRPLLRGGVSRFRYVSAAQWPRLRSVLVERSQASAALHGGGAHLEPRMTAYTPGETLHLLQEPEVAVWHQEMEQIRLPAIDASVQALVLVPCAKTKPWDRARIGLYGAYNRVRARVRAGDLPRVYFVTLSEPLGVVPECCWGDFPLYDNPGLFREDAQRCGLFTADWPRVTPFPGKLLLPFDEEAYQRCIELLGQRIGQFLARHLALQPHLKLLSFVDDLHGGRTSHRDMLDVALRQLPQGLCEAYPKKAAPRQSPEMHLVSVLQERLSPCEDLPKAPAHLSLCVPKPDSPLLPGVPHADSQPASRVRV